MSWDDLLKRNPWRNLPEAADYVLPEDEVLVRNYNDLSRPANRLRLDALPEPFIGSLEAPIWLLNLNPGIGSGPIVPNQKIHDRQLAALGLIGEPFWPLAAEFRGTDCGWWHKHMLFVERFGLNAVRQSFFCAELYGYHSEKGDASFRVSSQEFTFSLVREACRKGKIFVFLRAKSRWLAAVPELVSACTTQVRNGQRLWISEGNIENPDVVLNALQTARP